MKKLTQCLAFFLVAAALFSLVACSSDQEEEDDASTSSSILPDDFVVDTSVEDLCLATAGVPSDYVMFTVDGIEVTAGHFFYWLAYNISTMEYYYSYYGMELDLGEESDLAASLVENAKDAAALTVLTVYRAQELGYTLSDETLEEVDQSIASIVESYGGEESFQETLRTLGLDEDLYYLLTVSSYYYDLLEEEMYSGHPTEEEVSAYVEEEDLLYAKHILILTVDSDYQPLDEEELAERQALAEDILEQLQNSEDLETDFDTLMNEYSEDTGLASYPDGYLFTADEMVSEFEEATRELEYGELSGIVEHVGEDGESYSGYHIILRLDPADSEELVENWLYDQMETLLYDWRDNGEYVLSDAYNELDVELFYAKFSAYQEAFEAMSEETEDETTSDDAATSDDDTTSDDASTEDSGSDS
ncbi:MAG: peptidylprolyl isomerase [Oscillospiraceae bacterium]|nr:peptidylprolyl isomerase [Oscillospiraceae bacterium]